SLTVRITFFLATGSGAWNDRTELSFAGKGARNRGVPPVAFLASFLAISSAVIAARSRFLVDDNVLLYGQCNRSSLEQSVKWQQATCKSIGIWYHIKSV
ncbi:hypothetical protein QT572_22540, partial [Xanthomonas citri pv. citri]